LRKIETIELVGAVSSLSISPGNGYILAQSGELLKSYEIEHMRVAEATIKIDRKLPASNVKWLDIAHLWSDDGGVLTMRDFNSANVYSIMSVEPGFDASLSQNGRYFYAVGKTEKGYHLQRIKMILE
jgi:hypothetical protein